MTGDSSPATPGPPRHSDAPLLAARGVTRSFGATPALRGADLEVAAGEIVAVMGPSGSGKSTLLHCLAGILTPDAGEVWFAGERLDRMSDRARTELRRRGFGFVFQFGQLVPELPAVDNVALPLLLEGRPRTAALDEAAAWFSRRGAWVGNGRTCLAGQDRRWTASSPSNSLVESFGLRPCQRRS